VLWFVGLQAVVIKHFCRFCMVVHTCGAACALLLLKSAPFGNPPEKDWQREKQVFLPPAQARLWALAALGLLALLVGGQVLYRPQMYLVQNVSAGKLKPSRFAIRRNASHNLVQNVAAGKLKPADRIFQIYDGQFQFNLSEVPLIGNSQASNVILSLFDYTCEHCREMHPNLVQAQQTFSNQLVVVSLPMPLDSQCNPIIKRTPRPHVNACEYAKLGLAVWRAKRPAHHDFEEWLYAAKLPPALEAVRDRAAQVLGGTNALAQALADPWIARQLEQTTSLYATNILQRKNGQMPQLLIGTNLFFGSLTRIDDLYARLADQLGLRADQKTK
jgi:hypothetical protein